MSCTYSGGYQNCGAGHPADAQLFFNSMFLTPPYPSSLEVMIFAVIQAETNNQGCSSSSSYIAGSESFWGDLATLANAYPNIRLVYEIAFNPSSTVYGVSCFATVASYFTQFPSVYGIGVEGEYTTPQSAITPAMMQQAMSAVGSKAFISYYLDASIIPSGGYLIGHTNFPEAGDQVGTLSLYGASPSIGIDSGYYYGFPFPQTKITCPIGPNAIVTGSVEGWNQCVEQTELSVALSMPPATRQFLELDVAWSSSGSFTGVSGQTANQLWDNPTMRNWIWTDPNYSPNFILSTSASPTTTASTLTVSTSTQTSSATSATSTTSLSSKSSSSSTSTSSSSSSISSSSSTTSSSSSSTSSSSSSALTTVTTSTATSVTTSTTTIQHLLTTTYTQPSPQVYGLSIVGACPVTGAGTYAAYSTVAVVFSGVCNRNGESGLRVISWSMDGGSQTRVATNGTSSISIIMNKSHTITFNTAVQYQLHLDYGALNAFYSITSPSIPADNYWYDSGTKVTYYGNVNMNGFRAVDWELDGSGPVSITNPSYFDSSFEMSSPHTLVVLLSPADSCLTSGCSTAHTFELTLQTNAHQPGGVWIDGAYYPKSVTFVWQSHTTHNITAAEGVRGSTTRNQFSHWSGLLTSESPTIKLVVNGSGVLIADYSTTDLVSFFFTDAAGNSIVPQSVTLTGPAGAMTLGGNLSAWVAPSAQYKLASANWMNWNSIIANSSSFSISGPGTLSFKLAVYPETISATDAYNLPIRGATVNVTALNGETLSLVTGSTGMVQFRVPVGLFTAKVSYLGVSNQIVSSSQGSHDYNVTFLLSYPLIVTLGTTAVVVLIFGLFLRARKNPNGEIQFFLDSA